VAWQKLVLTSLALLDAHQWRGDERVADIGSGGGLPGIPLKIALPGIQVTLVESDQKKSAFLRDVALPGIFALLKGLRLNAADPVRIGGWAFRGLLNLPVEWDAD